MHVRLLNVGQIKGVTGACIHMTIPYIRDPIPVVIGFRALGFVSDREILEHIVCDFSDPTLMEMVRAASAAAAAAAAAASAPPLLYSAAASLPWLRPLAAVYPPSLLPAGL